MKAVLLVAGCSERLFCEFEVSFVWWVGVLTLVAVTKNVICVFCARGKIREKVFLTFVKDYVDYMFECGGITSRFKPEVL